MFKVVLLGGSVSVAMVVGPAFAGNVVDAGFCLRLAGRDCVERIPNGQAVALEDLERDEVGRRVLYFHSTMQVEQGTFFIHAWERNHRATAEAVEPKVYSSSQLPDELRTGVESVRLGQLGDPLNVVIEAKASSSTYRAVSTRYVYGPDKFVAKVVDPAGQDLPGSELNKVEVTRERPVPVASEQAPQDTHQDNHKETKPPDEPM
jgi:hypothetical protein